MPHNPRIMKPLFWHTTALAWRLVEFLCPGQTWGEWWRGVTPPHILGRRKKRLLAVACVRAIWPMLKEGRQERRWVDLLEIHADDLVPWRDLPPIPKLGPPERRAGITDGEADAEIAAFWCAAMDLGTDALYEVMGHSSWAAAHSACPSGGPEFLQARLRADQRQCGYIRDMAGDPFDPAPPGWADRFRVSPRIAGLVASIYRERAFHEMPALADALEAEGCAVVQALRHCRSEAEHVRGCWVIDELLGLPA